MLYLRGNRQKRDCTKEPNIMLWEQEVAGSNPATPTEKALREIGGLFCFYMKLLLCFEGYRESRYFEFQFARPARVSLFDLRVS
jgi:hypothetical protein